MEKMAQKDRSERHLEDINADTCSRAINRMKNSEVDFNDELQYGSENPDYAFYDDTFEFPDSIHWTDVPGQYPLVEDAEYI